MATHSAGQNMLIVSAVVVVLAGLKLSSAILVPFLLSVFIAIATNPVIKFASRYRIPRWLSIIIVILLIVIIGFMLAGLVTTSLKNFQSNLPIYETQLAAQFTFIIDQLARFDIQLDRALVMDYLDPGMAMSIATNFLGALGSVLSNFLLILLTVIFMLFEAESMPRRLHIAMRDPQMQMQHIDRFLASVNQYLQIKTVVSLGTGLCIGLFLWLLGVDHFMLWAVTAFLLNYIPNIGSVIAAIPAVIMAFIEFGFGIAGLTALGFVLVNTLMGNVIEPRFMGKGMGLSTLVVFLSLIFWGWLLGTAGMLLSVPLTMVVKIALEANQDTQWLAVLLGGDEPVKQPHG